MASKFTQEDIDNAVRIKDIPEGYDTDLIIQNLENAGTIKDKIIGKKEMIVIFDNSSFKDVSKMFNDCPVTDDYIMKIEDALTLEINEDVKLSSPKKESTNKQLLNEMNMGYKDPNLNKSATKESSNPIKFESSTRPSEQTSPNKQPQPTNDFLEFSPQKSDAQNAQESKKSEPVVRFSTEPETKSRTSIDEPSKSSPKKEEVKVQEPEPVPIRQVIEEPKVIEPVKKEEPVVADEPVQQQEFKEPSPRKSEPRVEEPISEPRIQATPQKPEMRSEPPQQSPPKREEKVQPPITEAVKPQTSISKGDLADYLERTNLSSRSELKKDDPAKQFFDFKYVFITLSVWALWSIISKLL